MANIICLNNLEKHGYKNIQEWMDLSDNVYVGKHGYEYISENGTERRFDYKGSKWKNLFDIKGYTKKEAVTLYVNYLFNSGLIYDIEELNGKNLGCFCDFFVDKNDNPVCHAKVLYDLLNKCYDFVKSYIDKRNVFLRREENMKKGTVTITFGERAENHVGMQMLGETLRTDGLHYSDLMEAKKKFEKKGVTTELINLNQFLPDNVEGEPAYLLIMRDAVSKILKVDKEHMFEEQVNLDWDSQAFMKGRVVNKHARYNLVYDYKEQEPDYINKKGRIVSWDNIPLSKKLYKKLAYFFGEKAENLYGEGNYYFDVNSCGIGFHGDSERRIVISVRLGQNIPIQYQWFYKTEPIGDRAEFNIYGGDMYAMSHKAVGTDWKTRNIPTLRHAAGCIKYLTIKQKK